MENIESSVEKTINKTTNALVKELEILNDKELHDLFIFFYQINHQQYNTIKAEKFIEFLESFKSNPFRKHEDKASRKELIENLLAYTTDPMSLLTAAMLIKRKFTLEEVTDNFYSSFDFYNDNWF
jgi:hypothetical protein